MNCDWVLAAPSGVVKTVDRMRHLHRREPRHQVSMKKSALRFLILTCLSAVAHCWWNRFVPKEMTWSDAKKYCRKYHTDLPSISNQIEDENFFTTVGPEKQSYAWIGLYKDNNNTWKWTGGKKTSFLNWAKAQSKSGGNRCAVQTQKGWRRRNCTEKHRFYCFDSRLVLVKENKTWEEAMEHCRSQHNHLVGLPSESALVHTLQASGEAQTDHVWTSLRYLADDWLWVNGYEVTYQAWGQKETPQCPAWNHRCGTLSLQGQHWTSRDCADKLNFICHQ